MKNLNRLAFLLVLFSINHIQAQVALDSGLVAYYPLDGDAADSSANSYDGTLHNTSIVAGRKGDPQGALKFNGVNSYVDLPDAVVNKSSGTISMQVSIDMYPTPGKAYAAFGSNAGFASPAGSRLYLTLKADSTIVAFYYNNQIKDSSFIYNLNTWYHIALTWRIDTAFFYFNNQKVGGDGGILQNAKLVSLGSIAEGFDGLYDGKIDDVRIYDRPLNDAEIQVLFDDGLSSTEYISDASINISPNPSDGRVQIKSDYHRLSKVELISVDGRKIECEYVISDDHIDLSTQYKGSAVLIFTTISGKNGTKNIVFH